jgi:hypothetical protein
MTSEELHQLIEAWREGTISPEDFARLDESLRTDGNARKTLRRAANLDSALRDWATRDSALDPWLPQTAPSRKSLPPWTWATAAAIALLFSLGIHFRGGQRPPQHVAAPSPEHTDGGCAVLAQTVSAQWDGDTHPQTGETVNPGPFKIRSGLAQIEFFSGSTLIVEGPAELSLISPWEAECRQGKARVRVPPAAHGFRFTAPGMKLVDLGTEFAVNIDPASHAPEVHVFNGEVIAHPTGGSELSLREGQSLQGATLASLDPKTFLVHGQLQELVAAHQAQRKTEWWNWTLQARQDDRLIAYYPMRHFPEWERLVNNVAHDNDKTKNGGAVGAVWTQGRWPGKDALEFKRPGSRVRLNIDGTYDAVTFACWAKVDGIDRKYSALILTDGYDPGEPHWQIFENGSLMFSIAYPDPAKPEAKRNQIYYSPAIFTAGNSGRWRHLAVTYDNQSGTVVQYVNGREVSREVSPWHQPGRPIVFGPCELGNWGLPTPNHQFPIRNLNGSIDEFAIYRAALSGKEIWQLYLAGMPD